MWKMRDGQPANRAMARLLDTSGAIMTEYAVVVGLCGILVSLAIASLGVPLVSGYSTARTILISTTP
jgi:hypothetical protein